MKNKRILKVFTWGSLGRTCHDQRFDAYYNEYTIDELEFGQIFLPSIFVVLYSKVIKFFKRYDRIYFSSQDYAYLYFKLFKEPVLTKSVMDIGERTFRIVEVQGDNIEMLLDKIEFVG
ncbi:hypothetical protein [Alkaliphilus sp. B6464]|uniref:hypothetical protein n=1 Tax=Alkaliphilus sp. B6464 TaxID=2731219 RepID=UPI001BABA5F2|nr:hypothetical protein [Alkaliphilus sp. B6464]QUH22174.1 hypothetical protein HYG84_19900 [Alkaliphilus sp. B6464]